MKVAAAKMVYKQVFWDKYHCGLIENQALATKCFDIIVNQGPFWGVACFQQALGFSGTNLDGKLGKNTAAAINKSDPVQLMTSVCRFQAARYEYIIKHDPTQCCWRGNWLHRASLTFGVANGS
jgi:lysozyme family protein